MGAPTLRPWYWPIYAVHFKVRIAEPSPGAFRAEADSPDRDAKVCRRALFTTVPPWR